MVDINKVTRLDITDGVAVLEIDSPPVNALGHAVRQGVFDGMARALADPAAKAIVIACAGRTFIAGADITEFTRPLEHPDLAELFARIEGADKPVVAAIHGTALGGGMELALSCNYRIAVPSAKIGLPEVHLGLMPGAGGTQRVPRLAGVAFALDFMVSGKPVSATTGLKAGLIDVLAQEDSLRADAIAYARRLVDEGAPLRKVRDLQVKESLEQTRQIIADFAAKNGKSFKGFKSPAQILKAVEAAVTLPFDKGLEHEWVLFTELLTSPESAAQRHIFFAERAAGKLPAATDAKPQPVKSVAVVGAGTMGSGIATAFLNAGLPVTLIDLNAEALGRAAKGIAATIKGLAEKGRITDEKAQAQIAALKTSPEIGATKDADLIVEAVFERMDLKKQVFAQIDAAAKPDAILASNTSFLDLNEIASATRRPQQVVGLHFFAPANVMRLLEVVRGAQTSDAVVATAMAAGKALGKIAVLSGVGHGFIANRVMERMLESASRLILQGPMPWDVDRAMADFGFPMGPFAMLDLVGLDVIGWDREHSAGRTVQEVLCEAGRWGQKKGAGYYDYDDRRRPSPSAFTEKAIRDFRDRFKLPQRGFTDAEIVEQLLYPVVNEAARVLEEGIAQRASDIDIALVAGYGWPVYRGGPMFWGDQEGLAKIVQRLEEWRGQGAKIKISALLQKRAAGGGQLAGA